MGEKEAVSKGKGRRAGKLERKKMRVWCAQRRGMSRGML
jgi:hypothetical protein